MNRRSIDEWKKAHEAQKIHLDIPGKPLGKSRPRVTRRGITYTPKATAEREKLVRTIFMETYHRTCPLTGALKVTIEAVYPVPVSASKSRQAEMMADKITPTVRPDVDNVAKLILDALNKTAYADDSQIVSLTVSKRYAYENELPHTVIDLAPFRSESKT